MRSTLTLLFAAFTALFLLPAQLFAYHAHPTAIESPRARVRFHPTREAHWVHPAGRQKIKSQTLSTKPDSRRKSSQIVAKNKVTAKSRELAERLPSPRTRRGRGRTSPKVVKVKQNKRLTVQETEAKPGPDAPPSVQTPVVSIIRDDGVHPQVAPAEEVVASADIVPGLYDGRGHLNMPAALRGSHEVLVHQNMMADQDGLTRIQDDDDLLDMRQKKMLVALPVNDGLRVDERLPANRRYCRPWVAQFLLSMGRAHYAQFHVPLQINSAVRTVSFQLRLMRTNGNAAHADGEAASPHLTGQAIDIGKKGMSQAEIAWMRLYLTPLLEDGRIDVEEEFQQACFHLSVYKRYAPQSIAPPRIAATHRPTTPALASTLE